MADRSSLRNFLSFASAVAYSVALAALSFSTCDFVRLNTRNPFICFLFRYLLSVRPNVRGEDGPLGGSVRYCRSFSAAERVHGLADHPNRVRGRGYGVRSTIAEVRPVGMHRLASCRPGSSVVGRHAIHRKIGLSHPGASARSVLVRSEGGGESDGASHEDGRELLQPERRRLLRDLESRWKGLPRDHDRRQVLQSVHALRASHPARGTSALRLVPGVQAGRLDLGLSRQLRAAVPREVPWELPRDVEAWHGSARPRAQVPASAVLSARTGRGKAAGPATGAAAGRGTC